MGKGLEFILGGIAALSVVSCGLNGGEQITHYETQEEGETMRLKDLKIRVGEAFDGRVPSKKINNDVWKHMEGSLNPIVDSNVPLTNYDAAGVTNSGDIVVEKGSYVYVIDPNTNRLEHCLPLYGGIETDRQGEVKGWSGVVLTDNAYNIPRSFSDLPEGTVVKGIFGGSIDTDYLQWLWDSFEERDGGLYMKSE